MGGDVWFNNVRIESNSRKYYDLLINYLQVSRHAAAQDGVIEHEKVQTRTFE